METHTNAKATIIEELAHTNLRHCYQCGKCSAGCPVSEHMTILPHQLIRLTQLGLEDKAMTTDSIWQCVSCLTCSTRCPQSVNCAGILDALRQLSVERSVASPAQRRTVIFQNAFLQNIRRYGRLNELELIGVFKTMGFLKDLSIPFLFKDALLGPKMMKRHKFHFTGEKVKDRDVVRRIFERCMTS